MNDSSNPTGPVTHPEQDTDENATTQTQTRLRKKLIQQIKDRLDSLKHEQVPVYSYGNFLAHVIEEHWIDEMEKLEKKTEKNRK